MSRSNSEKYHHGDLCGALIDAARELVVEGGVEALSLREVARRAGVSTAAPYHHFKDKADLTRAVARQSLEDLDRASREALEGKATPRERLQAIGVAYVLYAVDHPAEFRLMFRPEMGSPFDEKHLPEDAPVCRVLMGVVREFPAAGAGAEEGAQDGYTIAVAAWSLVHGLASLLVDGPLRVVAGDRERVRALAEQVVCALLPSGNPPKSGGVNP